MFCEPASAAAVAGLLAHVRSGGIRPASVVCILTGNGMKDPERAISLGPALEDVAADLDAVRAALRS